MALVEKTISGGQTGADRAALDVAIELGIPHGGWCPKGRKAEDGRIPGRYNLAETKSSQYPPRTNKNVQEADLTVIFTLGELAGGSALTQECAQALGKPCLHINLSAVSAQDAAKLLAKWLKGQDVKILNVAGSRESTSPGIYDRVRQALRLVLG